MHLGLSLCVSQSLELRQAMEITLTQCLSVTQKLMLSLTLYLKRESEITRLYLNALEHGMVRLYNKHGMEFEFALVSAKDVPANLKALGFAFSHCLFNGFEALFFGKRYAMSRGSWLLFVVYDMYPGMPESYVEYAAVHERGEQVTLGDHNLASKLEFAIARKENNLVEYIKWLEENCPAKFADVFCYQTHLDLPESDEFQKVLELSSSSEEAVRVLRMIEEFEWPYRILQKLMLYKKRNDEVVKIATQALRVAEILVEDAGMPLEELIFRVRDGIAKRMRLIAERKLNRFINFSQFDILWHELRIDIDDRFASMLNARRNINPDYHREFLETGIDNALPKDGVLSLSFTEVLQAL